MDIEVFIQRIHDCKKLYDDGINTYSEFLGHKSRLINELMCSQNKVNEIDFLLKINPLVMDFLLTQEELMQIKLDIARINKLNDRETVLPSPISNTKSYIDVIDSENYQEPITKFSRPVTKTSVPNNTKHKFGPRTVLILLFIIISASLIIYFKTVKENPETVNKSNSVVLDNNQSNLKSDSDFTNSVNESDKISKKIYDILKITESKSDNLKSYYSQTIDYYTWGLTPIDKLWKDKTSFFKKWDEIKLTMSNPKIQKTSSTSYRAFFDKEFETKNFSKNILYKGKVKSIMEFDLNNGEWLIKTEKDELSYYTEKQKIK